MSGWPSSSPLAVGTCVCALALLGGCSRDWDRYDPRAADGGAQGGADAGCGTFAALGDDFEDGTIGEPWWFFEHDGGLVAERDGQLVFTLPAGQWRGVTFRSAHAYDLRGSRVSIHVVQVPDAVSDLNVSLAVVDETDSRAAIVLQGASLRFEQRLAGVDETWSTTEFAPSAHGFWQLREEAGSLRWETSPDGAAWSEQYRVADDTLFPLDVVRLEIAVSGHIEGSDAEVRLDDANGGPPVGALCAASSLVDDFGDGVRSRVWSGTNAEINCTATETNGELTFALPVGVNGSCQYASAPAFDLRSSSAAVELVQSPVAGSQGQVQLAALHDEHNSFAVEVADGQLNCIQYREGAYQNLLSRAYSAADDRWLRLRNADGTTLLETSPDGRAWTARASTTEGFDASSVELVLGARNLAILTEPVTVRLDNFNRLP